MRAPAKLSGGKNLYFQVQHIAAVMDLLASEEAQTAHHVP